MFNIYIFYIKALKINQTLVGLSLSRNIIKDDGAIAIAKVITNQKFNKANNKIDIT